MIGNILCFFAKLLHKRKVNDTYSSSERLKFALFLYTAWVKLKTSLLAFAIGQMVTAGNGIVLIGDSLVAKVTITGLILYLS